MGEEICFNWMLKLPKKDLENLFEGEIYDFKKDRPKVYPLNKLIFLIDEEFNSRGIVEIEEFSTSKNETSGRYRVVYCPNKEEQKILNNLFKNMYILGDF